jgi:glycosyltransferase involved in cell wall biosynthesis
MISFVIPVKNEEASVKKLHKEIIHEVKKLKLKYEIIFIDDGSTDNTFQKIKSLAKKDSKIKVFKLRGNWGKSVGLSIGFQHATGNMVFTMDGDLQDDPKEISHFLKKLNEGYDLVSGWKKKRNDPLTKTLPSKVVNGVVRFLTGVNTHDMNCGFKVYRKEVLKSLNLYGDLYRFIPILAEKQNFKVGEIEVHHRQREFGKSKYGIRRLLSGWLDLLTIFFLIRYIRRPAHFFGTLGFVSFVFGFTIGIYITYLRITTGSIQNHHPLLFLGILLIVIGIQLISTGLLAEMIINARGKLDYSSSIKQTVNYPYLK